MNSMMNHGGRAFHDEATRNSTAKIPMVDHVELLQELGLGPGFNSVSQIS